MYNPNESEKISVKRMLKKIDKFNKKINKKTVSGFSEDDYMLNYIGNVRKNICDIIVNYKILNLLKHYINNYNNLYLFLFSKAYNYNNIILIEKSTKEELYLIYGSEFLKIIIDIIGDLNNIHGDVLTNIVEYKNLYKNLLELGYLENIDIKSGSVDPNSNLYDSIKNKGKLLRFSNNFLQNPNLKNIIDLKIIKEV